MLLGTHINRKKGRHGGAYLSSRYEFKRSQYRLAWPKNETLSPNATRTRRIGTVAQEVECLPNKCKILSSDHHIAKLLLSILNFSIH
jgi:hypothetical protein